MPLSPNINLYEDVRVVLDTALANKGARLPCPSPGQARHWMQRAYQFRKLTILALRGGIETPGYTPATPYDQIRLRIDRHYVVIEIRTNYTELLGLDHDGILELIQDAHNATKVIDDPLLAEAMAEFDLVETTDDEDET